MANITESIQQAMQLKGIIGVAIVDIESGMCLGMATTQTEFDMELAAAGTTEVVKAELQLKELLQLANPVEDILITVDKQYHVIRVFQHQPALFMYAVLHRDTGSLPLARLEFRRLEREFVMNGQ
ncbi:hypothetical protein [Beggiatoa leptomitoformis]|uniref:Roadblock/LC7 domain-containing protein n=1 Tax=Beggiatoa leptomitoformis TaxID=288004 RepID=A0A2N9YAH9_9GAMM|nr:hypothetical protein [Beggiatoa leptomitoformis]ALG67121.1 hypothetical protein AL038_04600 [Beggiatoa leptomitoformis]AUI67483.1 hypothetical protein BLE401_01405 [Beggiatoa leptomitoformis]